MLAQLPLFLALSLVAAPDPAAPSPRPTPPTVTTWHFGVRADPIVFALLGFSVGVDAMPEDSRWRASLAAFQVEVPQLLVPLVAQPSNNVRVFERAIQLGAFYDVDDKHRGLYFGPELYLYHLEYEVDGIPLEAREAYAHVTAGYTWFPLEQFDVVGSLPIFVQPWATIGVPIFHSGGAQSGGIVINDRALNWHATVSLGFRL